MSNKTVNSQQTTPTVNTSRFWGVFANIWLLFLVFPLISVVADDSLSRFRLVSSIVVLMVFAASHLAGYARDLQDYGRRPVGRWFTVLVLLTVVGVIIGGPSMLGMAPFLTPFAASSNLSLQQGVVVLLTTLTLVIAIIVLSGAPPGLFVTALVVFAVGAGSLFAKVAVEREYDSIILQNQLRLTEERSRVARDVHDVLGHSLTAVILKTQVAERQLATIETPSQEVAAARVQLDEIHELSRQALAEIRDTVDGLRSTTLEGELAVARLVLADADITLAVEGSEATIPDEYHTVIGWTVREAVTNVIRHARATACRVELGDGQNLVRITDDGVGRGNANEGNGLGGLRQRLARHGLELLVQDSSTGTAVAVVSP